MRIAHVITRLIVGGAQENTIASVLGLRQKPGLDVILISGPTHGPEGSLEPVMGPPSSHFILVPELVRPVQPWKDLRAWRRLTGLFREQQPDLVHTHSGKAGFLGRAAARTAGVPMIVHTVHGPSFGNFQGSVANAVFTNAERLAGRWTTHFVVVANAMRDQYLAAGIGRPSQYTTVYSGFPLEPYLNSRNDPELRARWGFQPEDVIVGKIARLFKLKGHEDLLAVAPELLSRDARIKLLLVGDGLWRERFQTQVSRLGLENRVIFTGLVPPEEVPRLLGIMNILVHLSLREGLPRAVAQALAAAKPVVAYDCDGAREVCVDQQTGFLLPVGDRRSLIERVYELAQDAELRSRLGVQGQALARSRFPVEKMVDDLDALYRRLSAARGGRGK